MSESRDFAAPHKVRGSEVKPGDILVCLGASHRIVNIEPYTHPTLGKFVGIARGSDGWGITLDNTCAYEVA